MADARAGGRHVVMPDGAEPPEAPQQLVEVPSELPLGTRVGLMAAAFMSGAGVATDDQRAARRVQQVIWAIRQREGHHDEGRQSDGEQR